jgi:type VI secretion system protein VasD
MRKADAVAVLAMACLQSGCGSNGLASAALEASGLRKPTELRDAQQSARNVPLRLHASSRLNLDQTGQPLALALRLYQLRQKEAFEQAPYSAFLDPQAERASLGPDLIAVREIMLVPGQRLELTETLSRAAGHLAIVALFQRPAGQRWRVSMPAGEAARAGLTIGLHACALTVGGSALGSSLSSVRCQ